MQFSTARKLLAFAEDSLRIRNNFPITGSVRPFIKPITNAPLIGQEAAMADKYEEMARQMRADGVSEEMIARFVAEEMKEDESAAARASRRSRRCGSGRRSPSISASCCSPARSAITAARRSSRPATRCACATAACSSRVAARNAGLRSPGCAISRPRNPAGDRRLPDERRSREPRRPQPLGQSL